MPPRRSPDRYFAGPAGSDWQAGQGLKWGLPGHCGWYSHQWLCLMRSSARSTPDVGSGFLWILGALDSLGFCRPGWRPVGVAVFTPLRHIPESECALIVAQRCVEVRERQNTASITTGWPVRPTMTMAPWTAGRQAGRSRTAHRAVSKMGGADALRPATVIDVYCSRWRVCQQRWRPPRVAVSTPEAQPRGEVFTCGHEGETEHGFCQYRVASQAERGSLDSRQAGGQV